MRSFIATMMVLALSSAPCLELFSAAPESWIDYGLGLKKIGLTRKKMILSSEYTFQVLKDRLKKDLEQVLSSRGNNKRPT